MIQPVYKIEFTKNELQVLLTALSCTEHLLSSTYQEKLVIQNDLASRVLYTLNSAQSGNQ